MLSETHRKILNHLADGRTPAYVAHKLEIERNTFYQYISLIKERLGARNVTHAVVLAMHNGFLDDPVPAQTVKPSSKPGRKPTVQALLAPLTRLGDTTVLPMKSLPTYHSAASKMGIRIKCRKVDGSVVAERIA